MIFNLRVFLSKSLVTRYLITPSRRYHQISCLHSFAPLCQQQKGRKSGDSGETSADNQIAKDTTEEKKPSTITVERISQKAGNFASFMVIIGGIFILLVVISTLYSELYSPGSVVKIQNKVYKSIKEDQRVQNFVGTPMICYGRDTVNRMSRQKPKVYEFIDDQGNSQLRMTFKISGPNGKATVGVEVDSYRKDNIISRVHVKQDDPPEDRIIVL